MKTAKSIILLTILGFFSCKNEKSYTPFQPATLSYIKSIKYDCISVDTLKETTNSFKSVWEHTYYDSIYNSLEKECTKSRKNYDCYDSINRMRYTENINGVLKFEILRRDSTKTTKAIVYENNMYDGLNRGYWVALSKDNGVNWKYFYTGITKANFYYFKIKSTIPLFLNDSVLQIESAIVRKTEQGMLPLGGDQYELIKDGLVVSINLNKLCLDSDNDGLTDIAEKKMLTNPFKADTDGDGIIDGQDNNPRFKDVDSNFLSLIRFLLEGNGGRKDLDFLSFDDSNINKTTNNKSKFFKKQVFLIVTDDPRILNLSRTQNTYIFLNESEFANYMKSTPVSPNETGIKIKRVGLFSEEYRITISQFTWTIDYLVTKKNSGWKIVIETSTIS